MDRNILPFIKVMLHLQLSSSTSLPIKPVKVLLLASRTVSMLQAWLAEHSQQHGASWNAEALLIHTDTAQSRWSNREGHSKHYTETLVV